MPNPRRSVRLLSWLTGGVLALSVLVTASPADAQSDILLRLRSGNPAGDRVRVDSAGGFLALGQIGIGIIPATGPGERTMWYPFKAAFRSGSAGGPGSTAWDHANIGFYSWAGGYQSQASAIYTFAFGDQTLATGTLAVSLGSANTVSGTAGFSVGASNQCTGFTCIALGYTNRAAGQGSVAIGYRVHASSDYAVSLGHRAHAKHTGAFTFGDASTTDSIRSTANNQFSARAAGGYRFFTNASLTTGVTLNAGGSSWNVVSDRNRKASFRGVDGEEILHRLRDVPVTTWRYRDEADRSVRHIGPMAQDWHRAFGFGGDGTTINMSDFDGVNLAAVKALEARTAALREALDKRDQEVRGLEQRVRGLEEQNASLERRLSRIEELLIQR